MEAGPTSSLPIYLDVFNTYTHGQIVDWSPCLVVKGGDS